MPEPVSENTINTGNTPPLAREALYVITIDELTGLTSKLLIGMSSVGEVT
jgi:hypothetical protein